MVKIDNMLAKKTEIAIRFYEIRRAARISQADLAARSGVSLGSIKRFEHTGNISLESLIKLAYALGYENDFDSLFVRKNYQSIFDVVNDGGKNAK